ncbi:putative ABC transport system permease protein [Anaerobacterium chartisolvens]|uniref:Putative ABC transport system permease protein n=1 Tax=Anaerobacterium chartisolvens TaxID=1297424 RepID=A0A369B4T2_9FIRM|nr:ABC transporter permease [Anaerobacterium chartisolvens]RCX16529.1 putative ABC transport system permease protein [Anaerobacterium chartisolvens]
MGFFQAYKMAIKSILSNKVRSFLTMLGVIIGVASVIAAVAFAQGSTKSITSSIEELGTNLIQVTIMGRNSNRSVSYEDLQRFGAENSSEIAMIAPQVSTGATVKVGTKTGDTSLIGTSSEYEVIKSTGVQEGRFLLSFDNDYMQKVAIVGTAVVNDVFDGQNPVGRSMKINGHIFKVVGVLTEKNGGQKQSDDDQIIIPFKVAQRMGRQMMIANYLVQAATPDTVDAAMKKLEDYFTKIYHDENAFRVFNQAQMISTLNSVTGSMMVVLGGIAAISLIVGGIGIMNIMMVSVTERTREIGIRKAIGAKKKSILIQFLIEAVMVTGIGGLLGVLFGVSIIYFIIGGFNITTPVYSPLWMSLSFGISLIIGVVFGMFPAYKAARLNPIDALRFE